MITVKHCPYHSVLKPVPREEKPACSWQLLPRWANASSQAPQPSASYFKKGDGGPSSELIIARKNKFQPYFPVSLIYKGFSIVICLLVFHWPAEVCQAQQGWKKGLSILQPSLLLLSYSFFHMLRGTCWICMHLELFLQLIFFLCMAIPLFAARNSMLLHQTKPWRCELTSSTWCSWADFGMTSNRSAQGNELIPNAA